MQSVVVQDFLHPEYFYNIPGFPTDQLQTTEMLNGHKLSCIPFLNSWSAKVQTAKQKRKEILDPRLVETSLLKEFIPDTVSSTTMLAAQLVAWSTGRRKSDADCAAFLVRLQLAKHEANLRDSRDVRELFLAGLW